MIDDLLSTLSDEQLVAATSNDPKILCLAAAGGGKTKTLIARIARLVSDGVDPKSILALTFTNAAAFEMKERYKMIPDIDMTWGVPEFRTFHSFCYSLIIKNPAVRAKLGYSKVPEICDEAQFKAIKARVKLALGIKLSDKQIDGEEYTTRAEQDQINLFKKALVKEIKKDNVITFDIMCYNVCELFERDDECVKQYKTKYTYLCVDEYQDTDPRQNKFVDSFPDTTNIYLCADALQNIYGFRNCTNQYVKDHAIDPKWTVIKLHRNYRSTKQICDFANKFSTYAKDDYRIEMKSDRQGDPVNIVYGSYSSYDHPVDEDHLRILLEKIKENKVETAILCRTNRECQAVKEALTNAGIQFSARVKSNDNINLLESALSNEYMLEWLSTKLEGKDYGDYIRLSSMVSNPDIRWFLDTYGNREIVKRATEQIIEIRNITALPESQKDKFEKITKLLRVKTKCKFTGDDTTNNRQLVESIRDQLKEMEENVLYVGTIHSSKGLEYDTVYVMGVDDKMFKLGTEEMNNLYYVAITRAKNHLTVFRR